MGYNLCVCGAQKKYTALLCRDCTTTSEPLPMLMGDAEVAWLAGLLEGEGCWSNNGSKQWHLQITMTDRDIIERVAKMTGVGRIYKQERGPNNKDCYRWQVSKKGQREHLTRLVWPWLGVRRREKILALWPEMWA